MTIGDYIKKLDSIGNNRLSVTYYRNIQQVPIPSSIYDCGIWPQYLHNSSLRDLFAEN